MKKRNNGISLLVLIITIIVMIILASAVILSITSNNPISKANETKVKTDLTALKDEYNNFYSSALFDNVSNTKGYYTDKMNITKEGNIIYKGKIVNEGENNSLASIMPSIVGTEYEGKVFVADGKIYIDNRDNFLSEEQQEWAKEVGINVLNEGEVLVLSTEEVSLKISQKERIYATVMPDTDSQVEFDIDAKTLVRQLQEETNTIDIQGISDGVAILTAKVTAKDGTEIEKKVTIKVNVGDYIKVERITIDPSSVVLGLDEHAQLKAIITPETADNQEIEWKTEDDNIASVSEIGNITGENVGSTTITAIGEYGHITGECSVNVIDRTIITLDKKSITRRKGETEQITATVEHNTREDKVKWESQNKDIADVDENGLVIFKEVGSTTITATCQTKSVTCNIQVLEPLELKASSVEARGTKAKIKIDADTTYSTITKIEVKYKEQGTENWTTKEIPVNAKNYNKEYEIDGLTAEMEYSVEVTAHIADGNSKTVSFTLTPDKIPVTNLTLNQSSISIPLGNTEQLTATISPDDATYKGIDWKSDDGTKATVDANGLVTAKGLGSTRVTATSQDNAQATADCQVEITEPISLEAQVLSGEITDEIIPISIKTSTLHGTISSIEVSFKKELEQEYETRQVEITPNQTKYEDTYQITGLTPNTKYDIQVKVTISSEIIPSHSKSINELKGTTLKRKVTSLKLNENKLEIPLGDTRTLTATISPDDATFKEVDWQSSEESIATVEGGTITTREIGQTEITATSHDNKEAKDTCIVDVIEPITLETSIDDTTFDKIPVNIKASTKFGTITKIEVKYKESNTSGDWKTENVNDIGTSAKEYNKTYTLSNGLKPDTTYNIQVIVTISTDHSLTNKEKLTAITKKIDVTKISVNPTSKTIVKGNEQSFEITATIEPTDATNQGIDWSTSNGSVATVTSNGVDGKNATVNIIGIGTATITAKSQDDSSKTATCTITVQDPVARVDTKYYTSLQSAFNNVTGNPNSYNEVEILKDITNETSALANNKYAKLNLGTHKITNTSDKATITNEGNMEIIGEGNSTISNTGGNAIENMNTLTINTSGTITSDKNTINNTGTLSIYAGTITSSTGSDSNNSHGINNSATTANLSITGGKVEGNDGIRNSGTLTIAGGEVKSNNDDAIEFANGKIDITGGSVTGTNGIYNSNGGTASSKVLTIGNNSDGKEPSTTSPEIKGSKIGIYNGSSTFTANFYDGSVTGETQFNDENEVNIPKGYGIVLNEKTETLKKAAVVNEPKILEGMTPITFDKDGKEKEIKDTNSNWYSYVDQGEYKHDGRKSHWANAKTADGSQWVWIPRYAYKIVKEPEYTGSGSSLKTTEGREIDIKFMSGTSYDKYIDENGEVQTLPSDYIVHPAFVNESNTSPKFKNGGWDSELTGIWVAKYEAGQGGTRTENTSKQTYPKFVPNVTSYGNLTIGDMFTLCKNLATNSSNPYGFSSSTVDTHQMKNSEWGAVAYLTQSKYGRNGVEVTQNKYNGSSAKTGYGENESATYNTMEGQKASTTGNIYGIYDMSGGANEYTAGYLNNGKSLLKSYGQSLLDETNNKNGEKNKGISTKYVSVYNVGTSDSNDNNYNESTNSTRKGEAIWETSKSGSGYTSWFGDYSYFSNTSDPFLYRGGSYRSSGAYAGLFDFYSSYGYAGSFNGFRAVCVQK